MPVKERKLRIFKIESGGTDWFAGFTAINGLVNHLDVTGMSILDVEDCELSEVPENMWDELWVNNEAGDPAMTFRQALKKMNGEPGPIASTEW